MTLVTVRQAGVNTKQRAEAFCRARVTAGITQTDAAARAGLRFEDVVAIERGQKTPATDSDWQDLSFKVFRRWGVLGC
jgi:transcriptional regulator with XRE-family HTH domain